MTPGWKALFSNMMRALRRARRVPLAVLAGLVLGATGCGPQDSDRRIILLTIDSLRPDRLEAYGSGVSMMPALDELAGHAVVFETAVSPAPVTFPALAGVLTGRPPSLVGVVDDSGSVLTGGPRLPGRLLAGGWSTGAFVNAPFLDQDSGIFEGFRHAFNPHAARDARGSQAPVVLTDAAEFLDRNRKIPTFAWIHLFDSHYPYTGQQVLGSGTERYDAALVALDRSLAAFFARLEEKRLWEDAWIVIAGDHAEALGAEGELTHGLSLGDATLRVPLMVRTPRGELMRRVQTPVSLLDLAATIADIAGIGPWPGDGALDGRSLSPLVERGDADGAGSDRRLYAETYLPLFEYHWPPRRRFVVGEPAAGAGLPPLPALPELTAAGAVTAAPHESLSQAADDVARLLDSGSIEAAVEAAAVLAAEYPRAPVTARLHAAALQLQGRASEAVTALRQAATRLDGCPDLWAALAELEQDLGRSSAEAWGRAADAAGFRLRFRMQQAAALLQEGRPEDALQAARQAVAAAPASATVNAALGRTLLLAGQPEQAMRMYATAATQSPGSALYYRGLAAASQAAGQPDAALKALDEAERIDPSDREVQRAKGDVHVAQGDLDAAREAYRRALPRDTGEPTASLSVAEDLLRAGALELAATEAQQVLAAYPDTAGGHYLLGQIELARRNPGQAEEHLLAALRAGGEQATVYYGLARAALMQADEEQALNYLDRVFAADDPLLRQALRVDNLMIAPDAFPEVRLAVERYLAGGAGRGGDMP